MSWERNFVSEWTGCQIIQGKTHRKWSNGNEKHQITQHTQDSNYTGFTETLHISLMNAHFVSPFNL